MIIHFPLKYGWNKCIILLPGVYHIVSRDGQQKRVIGEAESKQTANGTTDKALQMD